MFFSSTNEISFLQEVHLTLWGTSTNSDVLFLVHLHCYSFSATLFKIEYARNSKIFQFEIFNILVWHKTHLTQNKILNNASEVFDIYKLNCSCIFLICTCIPHALKVHYFLYHEIVKQRYSNRKKNVLIST